MGVSLYTLLSVLTRVKGLPLQLNPVKYTDKTFRGLQGLLMMILSGSVSQILSQVPAMVGSSTVLGQPTSVVYHFRAGMQDTMRLSAGGLRTSPLAFVSNTALGVFRLVALSVGSLLESAGSIQGSLLQVIAAVGVVDTKQPVALLCAQSDDKRERDQSKERVADLQIGLSRRQGMMNRQQRLYQTSQTVRPHSVLEGIAMGVTGLWVEPFAGIRRRGLLGLVIGLTRGSVGLFTKPMYGLLVSSTAVCEHLSSKLLAHASIPQRQGFTRPRSDLSGQSASGVQVSVNDSSPIDIVPPEGDTGRELLSRVLRGRYLSEGCVWFAHAQEDTAILTKNRLLLVRDRFQVCEVQWNCALDRVVCVDLEDTEKRKLSRGESLMSLMNQSGKDGVSGGFSWLHRLLFPSSASSQTQTMTRVSSSTVSTPRLVLFIRFDDMGAGQTQSEKDIKNDKWTGRSAKALSKESQEQIKESRSTEATKVQNVETAASTNTLLLSYDDRITVTQPYDGAEMMSTQSRLSRLLLQLSHNHQLLELLTCLQHQVPSSFTEQAELFLADTLSEATS
eukprot:CAMPEP_0182423786 /NCGR_PEP_ID=MMETSP1167-20130531/9866_1 /TAXON_ID=2988 /ORGANISM="Mallomonas Sp, Strain CCMP3275" /LENGTH=560 /DNA_ID=CAMNT_0024603061 /DNA_START=1 /DNA_END=1686 /DNA_ORIENTATION=-